MNLKQLELFVAVAKEGSMSRGADAVSLAQSTASQHIAALEEEAGVPLLDRAARGVSLSPAGALFLKYARRVLNERDLLVQSMAAFKGLEKASLTIGASNIPANYLVPPLLPALQQKHPGITLSVVSGDSQSILEQLIGAEVELALVGSRSNEKSVRYTPLINDPLVLVVGAGHCWSGRDKIDLDELYDESLIVREKGSGSGQTLETAFNKHNVDSEKIRVAARLGSNEAVLQAVANGFGCAFVSELSARDMLTRNELVVVHTGSFTVDRNIWIAQSRARSLSPAALAFNHLLTDYYSGFEET